MTLPNPFPSKSPQKKSTQDKIFKAGKDKFLIEMILDESGSMGSAATDTIGSVNTFVDTQKKENSDAQFSLTTFNDNSTVIYNNINITEIPEFTSDKYRPTRMTALNDAIGLRINNVNEYLSGMKKKDRPFVLFCILTDGYENSSRNFTSPQIKTMIEKCQSKGWDFTFLGADIDAFAVGSAYGIADTKIASYSKSNMRQTFNATSQIASRTRGAVFAGLSASTTGYHQEEREKMNEVASDEKK